MQVETRRTASTHPQEIGRLIVTGACVKIGLVLEGLGSGLWYLSSSGDSSWVPVTVAAIGAIPLVRGWADGVFAGGEFAPGGGRGDDEAD